MFLFRLCVLSLVIVVQLQYIGSKPFLGFLICDYICDDDDDSSTTTTTSSSTDDMFGLYDYCDCTPTTRRPPVNRQGQGVPPMINMRLPPSSNGMNVMMGNANGVWTLTMDALPNGTQTGGGMNTATTTSAPTTVGGATTPAATTAAATTAKK